MAVVAPAAIAQECTAVPGVAATQQYCEVLPAAEGPGTPLDGDADTAGPADRTPRLEDVLPPDLVQRLREAGPEGEELLRLPAPPELLSPEGTLTAEGRAAFEDAVEALLGDDLASARPERRSALQAVGSAAGEGGALSPALRWGLVGSLVGLAAVSLASYRARRVA